MLVFIGLTLLALVSTAVIWEGSEILEKSSEKLAVYYELPAIVQGAIIAAIGSSFPEFSTTVISSLIHGEFELGVAAIVGSAIFNILVIPGLAGLFSEDTLQSNRKIVYKEAQFYMLSVAVLLISFSFAVIYHPVSSEVLIGEMTRWIAIIPVALYVLYVFIQWQDTMDYEADKKKEDIQPVKQWGWLVLSLLIVGIGVEGLVRAAIGFGELFNTPSFLWGLTIIAIGTSLPDAFISIKSAQEGKGTVSIANVLGSNIFDLLIAIPAGILIAGTAAINFGRAAPMMAILVAATIILFTISRTDFRITTKESWFLIFCYFAFVAWMVLETIGVTSVVL
ncbi:MAG: sodium:calcium antiporter [Candidatus Magasanikbacteria bacterium]